MSHSDVHVIELYAFRFHADHLEYLVLKRSPHDPLYPGIWQIVTGSIESGETAIEAALREFQEETGLPPSKFWVLPQIGSFYDYQTDTVRLSVLFACQVPDGRDPRLSEEHVGWQWLPAAEATLLLAWPSQGTGVGLVEKVIGHGEQAGGLLDLTERLP